MSCDRSRDKMAKMWFYIKMKLYNYLGVHSNQNFLLIRNSSKFLMSRGISKLCTLLGTQCTLFWDFSELCAFFRLDGQQ